MKTMSITPRRYPSDESIRQIQVDYLRFRESYNCHLLSEKKHIFSFFLKPLNAFSLISLDGSASFAEIWRRSLWRARGCCGTLFLSNTKQNTCHSICIPGLCRLLLSLRALRFYDFLPVHGNCRNYSLYLDEDMIGRMKSLIFAFCATCL